MFKGLIGSTMRFFDTNPSGRILNRFSKDMGSVDEYLPKALLDATQIILNMTGAITVASIVNPLFLVPIFVLGIAFVFIRRIYLKTSKNLKRMEGVCKFQSSLGLSQLICELIIQLAFTFRSIAGIHTSLRHLDWSINDSGIQCGKHVDQRIRWSSGHPHRLLVHVHIDQFSVRALP